MSVNKCRYCGKDTNNKFCNHQCYYSWMRENGRKKENHPGWKGGKITVQCAYCGNSIKRLLCEVENRSEVFFCNSKCHGKWFSKNKTRENHPNWKGRIIVQCAYCNKDVEIEKWRPKVKNHFCSQKCASQWVSENLTGDKRYNWRGGRLRYYGPNWNSQKYKARKRDNFTCVICKIKESDYIKISNQILHVHHIKPFREFNYIYNVNNNYVEANKLSNLITVCVSCHRKIEPR